MSALANSFDCSECQRLASKTSELEAEIAEARAQLEQAVEAADGTSARKHNALQDLIKAGEQLASEMQTHGQLGRHGYLAEAELTHSTIEA
jgi:ABC-type transporter Mla subunit MlaD